MKFLTDEQLRELLPAETSSFPSPVPTQIVSSDEYLPVPQTERQREVEARLKDLARLRDRLTQGFLQRAGVTSRELSPEDVWRLHYELLNPTRARTQKSRRDVVVCDDLWSDHTIRAEGDHLREYTEAEQLCFENIEDRRGCFRHGELLRRVLTLKFEAAGPGRSIVGFQ